MIPPPRASPQASKGKQSKDGCPCVPFALCDEQAIRAGNNGGETDGEEGGAKEKCIGCAPKLKRREKSMAVDEGDAYGVAVYEWILRGFIDVGPCSHVARYRSQLLIAHNFYSRTRRIRFAIVRTEFLEKYVNFAFSVVQTSQWPQTGNLPCMTQKR
jgi:hypothetical protein